MFLLTKRARYFYDADAVREEPTGRTDPIRSFGHVPERNDNGHTFALDAMKGRNLRNVWTIATHAYPNAHFATFAPELAERCIRAGTSERGCCAQCGAPWVRTTKATGGILGKSWHDHSADAAKGNAGVWVGQPAVEPYQRTTIAWSPSCKCQANYDCSGLGCGHQPCICIGVKPCTVLDCFSGAGTALLVADRLQRHAIGIDLNPAYLDMSTARIREDLPLFVDIATTEALQQVDEQREHQLEMFQAVE
ncbi:MAG TPA: DNA methyltransferase [Steroidobacteraceae bacterium]